MTISHLWRKGVLHEYTIKVVQSLLGLDVKFHHKFIGQVVQFSRMLLLHTQSKDNNKQPTEQASQEQVVYGGTLALYDLSSQVFIVGK